MTTSLPSPLPQAQQQPPAQTPPASQPRPRSVSTLAESPAESLVESPVTLSLPNGESARVHNGAIEIHDSHNRLVVRYDGNHAELIAPGGDLTLAAPEGDVIIRSGRALQLQTEKLNIEATDSTLTSQRMTLSAGRLTTTARTLTQRVEHFELAASEIVERTRDAFREASGLVQTRASRMRTLIDKSFDVFSERTSLVSTKDTSIDGEKILLG